MEGVLRGKFWFRKKILCYNSIVMVKKATGKKSVSTKKKTSVSHVNRVTRSSSKKPTNVCHTCHILPVGSVEIVSLLLVLVFSLTAVLMTAVHSITLQNQEIKTLKSRVTHL